MASWLGWALFGGAILGTALADAKAWVIERWGGRLAAYLLLKARNLRNEHIAFRDEPISLLSSVFKLPPRSVVQRDCAANCEQGSEYAKGDVGRIHNVIPLRKKS